MTTPLSSRSVGSLLSSFFVAIVLAALTLVAPALAADDERATVTVMPGALKVKPGQTFPVAVVIDLESKWHINTDRPEVPKALGESEDFIPTTVTASASTGGALRPVTSAIQWPKPVMVTVAFGGAPAEYGVFEGRAIAYLPVTVASDASPGLHELTLRVGYQACDDQTCLAPVEVTKKITVAVDPSAAGWPADKTYPELFTGWDASKLPAAASSSGPTAANTNETAHDSGSGLSPLTLSIIVAGAALVAILVGFVVVKKVL